MRNDVLSTTISFITGGAGVAIATVYEAIGIIVLILSALNIIINMSFKIRDAIKNKQYNKITEIIDDAKEDLEDIKEDDKDV